MPKLSKHQILKTTNELNISRCLSKKLEDGDYVACEQFLKIGANPNLLLPEGITPFHLAVGNDAAKAIDLVRLCLEYGADCNVRSAEGLTPVHVSAIWGRTDILKVLLNNGGNPSLVDEDDNTALDLALENGQTESVNIILEREKCTNMLLSISSISLGEDTYLIKKTPKRSFVIPKSSSFSEPLCCQYSPDDQNSCQSPAESSFRHRRSLSDSLFSRSYSSSFHLEKSPKIQKNSPDHSKSLFDIEIGSNLTKEKSTNLRSAKKLDFNFVNPESTSNSSAYITCNETALIEAVLTEESQTQSENTSSTPNAGKNNFSDDDNCTNLFSPAEILSCDRQTQKKVDFLLENPENENGILGDAILIKKRGLKTKDNFTTSSPVISVQSIYSNEKYEFPLNKIKIEKRETENEEEVEEYIYTDEDEGIALIERRQPSIVNINGLINDGEFHSWEHFSDNDLSQDSDEVKFVPREIKKLDDNQLRMKLIQLGYEPGPITSSTRGIYELKLATLQQHSVSIIKPCTVGEKVYSRELRLFIEGKVQIQKLLDLEEKMCQIFDVTNNNNRKNWREGKLKNCFNYLLLDPRVTKNLPGRAHSLSESDQLKIFLSSIFYIGKGKRTRPYSHLYDAALHLKRSNPNIRPNSKVQHILNIWADGSGVVSLHCFQNVIAVEAYTREACMVDAIGLKNLTNMRNGDVYGAVTKWTGDQKRYLGALLLSRACQILIHEGERQIRPSDV